MDDKKDPTIIEILHHSHTRLYSGIDNDVKEYEGDWHCKVGKRLAEREYDVECWRPEKTLDKKYERESENFIFKVFTSFVISLVRWDLEISVSMLTELWKRRHENIVLELHGAYAPQNVLIMILFGSYFPIMVQVHGGCPKNYRYQISSHPLGFLFLIKWQFEKLAFSKVETVFCLNDVCNEEQILSKYTETEMSPMGVDFDKFNPVENPKYKRENKITLGYLGRLENGKGIDLILEANKLVQREDDSVELLIAGEGSYKENVVREILEGDVSEVEYLGFLPSSDLQEFYSSLDLFIFASTAEAYGITPIESLACGTPVVGTDTGAVREVVNTFDAGVVVEPNSSQCLKNGILDALDQEFKLDREAGKRKYSWASIIDGREYLIETLVN